MNITSGPQDTTVCLNVIAPCPCGFTGADPSNTIPNWRILYRNDSGSVISNDTIVGYDIVSSTIVDLKWIADLNNASNSKLLVGPVNMTHNQSSYQCMFTILREGRLYTLMSSVGTLTVLGKMRIIQAL